MKMWIVYLNSDASADLEFHQSDDPLERAENIKKAVLAHPDTELYTPADFADAFNSDFISDQAYIAIDFQDEDEVVKRVWASQNIKKKDHYVQSSAGHLTYTVRYRDEDGWTCTCPAFTYQQGYCKHIRQVLANPQEFMSN